VQEFSGFNGQNDQGKLFQEDAKIKWTKKVSPKGPYPGLKCEIGHKPFLWRPFRARGNLHFQEIADLLKKRGLS
jgi:hypothetical protein